MVSEKNSSDKGRVTPSAEERTYLELLRTCDQLTRHAVEVLKAEDLSSAQYNVLRILRGAQQDLTCGEIAERLITRDPDITRLLDRMEKRGLILRARDDKDRRVVLTRITKEGLKLLERLDEPVQETHRAQLGHMSREKLKTLSALLREARKEG